MPITCILCEKESEDTNLFVKDSRYPSGVRNKCKECQNISNRRSDAKRRYNVTYEFYKEKMDEAKGCKLCGSTTKLGYDHCHDTMRFRGVLCMRCNTAIGQLGDTVESITKILEYVKGEK